MKTAVFGLGFMFTSFLPYYPRCGWRTSCWPHLLRWEWLRVRNLPTWWASSRTNPWSSSVEGRHGKVGSPRPAALASSTSDRALPAPPGPWRWAALELKHFGVWDVGSSDFLLVLLPGWALCLQSEHQRRVCAEKPEWTVCVAGRRWQRWGDGCGQTRGDLSGWRRQPGVRGQRARWVFTRSLFKSNLKLSGSWSECLLFNSSGKIGFYFELFYFGTPFERGG